MAWGLSHCVGGGAVSATTVAHPAPVGYRTQQQSLFLNQLSKHGSENSKGMHCASRFNVKKASCCKIMHQNQAKPT
eukprot:2916961-Amphidinium_carterae.1